MKKIKTFLKIAILMAFITLIFSYMIDIAYGSTSTSTIGKSNGYLYINSTKVTNQNVGNLVKNNRSTILGLSVSDLESLYSANMAYSSTTNSYGGDTRAPNQICLAHWDATSNSSEAYWELDLMLKIARNTTNVSYTAYSVYGSSSYQEKSTNATSYEYVVELAYALYQVYTESYTKNGSAVYPIFTPEKAAAGYFLSLFYNDSNVHSNYIASLLSDIYDGTGVVTRTKSDGVNNTNSNLDEDNFESETGQDFDELYNDLIDAAEAYYASVVNYKAVSVSGSSNSVVSDGTETVSGSTQKYIIVGPLTVTYGGKNISSIEVYNGSSSSAMSVSVGWATSATSSSFNFTSYKNIPSGTAIYLKIRGSSLPTSDSFTIKFNQSSLTMYNNVILMFGRTLANAQQQGVVASNSTSISKSASITINQYGNLKITKTDYASTSTTLSGTQFVIVYKNSSGSYYWMSGTATGTKTYTPISTSYSTSVATTYTTGSDGTITLNKLKFGTYYIYEIATGSDYYYLADQSDASNRPDLTKVDANTGWRYCGNVTVSSSHTTSSPATVSYSNKKSGNLTITKTDADISNTTLSGAQFVLVYKDSSNNYYWVKGSESAVKTYTSVSNSYSTSVATTYTTDSNGQITLNKLRLGTYYIYEIATSGEPYYLADQSDASGRPTITNVSSSWRYCGSKTVSYTHTESSPQTIEITNKRRVKISGYVWVERDPNKNSEYDDDYDSSVDSLLEGVKVYLYKKNGTTSTSDDTQVTYTNSSGTTVKYETTDSSGAYTFGYSWGILYEDLDDYYVKFDYSSLTITDDEGDSRSGTEYIPVAFNNGYATSTQVVANSSKAMMSSVAEYDTNLTGVATTYTGTSSTYETLYGLSGNLLIKSGTYQLYSTSTNTLANINLGIKPIYEPDYEISETLSYVKLVINDYTYYYEYGDDGSAELSGTNAPTIRYQHPTRTDVYQLSVYPSEVYKMKETSNNSYIEMYVVYAIKVTDTEQEDEEYLYSEQKLYVTSLSNTYDPGRYELCSTVDSDSEYDLETTASSDFTKWTASSSTGSATMTTSSGSTEKVTTQTATYNSTFNMSKSNSVTKYIQFKVQSDAILEMLDYENGIAEDYPTTATSTAYHTYTRYDYSWTNATTSSKGLPYKQTHKTASATRTDSAPYLVLSLGDEKVISGTVFEDEVSSTYSTEDGEVLGNGMYDSGENTVSGVIVELLSAGSDIESSSIAKLYQSGEYSNGTWNYTVCDAITYSASDGTYSFKGVVVGTYYLKFIYPNGDETIVDADGNKIDTITDAARNEATTTEITTMINGEEVSLNDYKSTIVTSDTVTEALQAELYTTNSYDEEWYKDYDGESNTTSTCNNYSIAVDDLDTRTAYNNDSTSVTNIFAGSAKLDITIENTESNYTDGDTHVTTYKGFNLGLIKQAVQSVEVEKKITNVKLVNSPTVIFNGNPETDDMTGVTDLDGTTNEGSTYTRVEIEEDSIYGSELTITYTITITNTSDVNYYEIDEEHYGYYYMFGLHDSSYSEQVEINLDEVVDCYDTALEYVEDSNTTGSIAKITLSVTGAWQDENNADCDDEIETCIETQNVLCYGDESTRSEEFEQALVITNLGQIARNADVSIDLDFKKVLSTEDEDMIFVNAAGVSVLTNVVTEETAEKIKQGTIETTSITLIRNPDIPDPSEAELTVIPPTGEDMRTPMIYAIVGIAILVILAAGVIIIRKKVRKLK